MLAIECLDCYQDLAFTSSEAVNTTRPECAGKNVPSQLCVATLLIYFENGNATAIFTHLPEQTFILSNRNRMVINATTIWFTKTKIFHSLQSFCINSTACTEDVSQTYNTMKNLKYVEVQTKLGELLHSDQSFVVNLTCSNNYNQSIECPNGYCQLIRRGTSNIDRKCIPQGGNINPSGIMIETNTMEGQDAESTFTYACTKQMCNGITTGEEVQTLLMQYGLLPTPDIISPSVQETTTAQTLSKPNTAMAILYKPMMNLQWMLLLIITMFLKI